MKTIMRKCLLQQKQMMLLFSTLLFLEISITCNGSSITKINTLKELMHFQTFKHPQFWHRPQRQKFCLIKQQQTGEQSQQRPRALHHLPQCSCTFFHSPHKDVSFLHLLVPQRNYSTAGNCTDCMQTADGQTHLWKPASLHLYDIT